MSRTNNKPKEIRYALVLARQEIKLKQVWRHKLKSNWILVTHLQHSRFAFICRKGRKSRGLAGSINYRLVLHVTSNMDKTNHKLILGNL